jgi:hypothetical protein
LTTTTIVDGHRLKHVHTNRSFLKGGLAIFLALKFINRLENWNKRGESQLFREPHLLRTKFSLCRN